MSVADAQRYAPGGPLRLRARWVVPVDMPPIENGEVVVDEGQIVSVGKATGEAGAHDFGMAAIMPGFVNCRTRLEHTLMRGLTVDRVPMESAQASAGLKAYVTLDGWNASAALGAAELLHAGVTTATDTSESGASLPAFLASGLRGIVYRKVGRAEGAQATQNALSALHGKLTTMRATIARMGGDERVQIGVAPSGGPPEFLGACAAYAAREGLPQTLPVVVSGTDGVQILRDCGALTPGTLATVAGLGADGIALLKACGISVVHCPKQATKLALTGISPSLLLEGGIPLGLGTGSVTTSGMCDLFEEMRLAVYQTRTDMFAPPVLTARKALHLATLGGAAALGMDALTGSLRRGKQADLCVVRLDGLHVTPTADDSPEAALVYGARASDVALTMVGGRVVYEAGRCVLLDVPRLRQAVGEARAKLRREATRILGTA